ncbi:hypothetical protein D3C78_1332480 [compost metagenome]
MYIPFKLLIKTQLDELARSGNKYLVLQNFKWPNLGIVKGLMIHPYNEPLLAKMHQVQMGHEDATLYEIGQNSSDIELLMDSKEHLVFSNEVSDNNWRKVLVELYGQQIKKVILLRDIFPLVYNIKISFQLEMGQLFVLISNDRKIHKEPFYDFVMECSRN